MLTLKISNFWYNNKMLQEHSNWLNFTLYNLSSTELNILKLKFKLKYSSKLFNFRNKFINIKQINFNIFNKNTIVISSMKNMYFFRTYIFTILENISISTSSVMKLLGYFNNLNFISIGILLMYKSNSVINLYTYTAFVHNHLVSYFINDFTNIKLFIYTFIINCIMFLSTYSISFRNYYWTLF